MTDDQANLAAIRQEITAHPRSAYIFALADWLRQQCIKEPLLYVAMALVAQEQIVLNPDPEAQP